MTRISIPVLLLVAAAAAACGAPASDSATPSSSSLAAEGPPRAPGGGSDPTVVRGAAAAVVAPVRRMIQLNVNDFGASGDGVSDDTAAIQAAIDAAGVSGAEVFIPAGRYVVSSASRGEVLRITSPVSIRGAGPQASILLVDSRVPPTADVLHYVALSDTGFKNLSLSDLGIVPQSGTPGRFAIDIDTTTGPIANMTISRIYAEQLGSGSLTNTNPVREDGWFTSTIRDCFFVGGLRLNRAGDSIRVESNTITGAGVGIDWGAVPGTSVGLIANNNITTKDTAIRLRSAYRTVIRDNNIEPASEGYVGVTLIDIVGGVDSPVYETRITGNSLLASLAPGTDAIRLDHVLNPFIGSNTIYVAGSGRGVVTTPNTVALRIDRVASAWAVGPTQIDDPSGQVREALYVPYDATGTIGLGPGPVWIGASRGSGAYPGALVLKGRGDVTQTIYGSSNDTPPRLSFVQEGADRFDIAAGQGIAFYQSGVTRIAEVSNAGRGAFAGGISPGSGVGTMQAGTIYQGIGPPSNASGNDGDFFFRTDTPRTARQRLYVKTAGSWVGIL